MRHGSAKPTTGRAVAFSTLMALGLFASLSVAVVARGLVARSNPELLQPFVVWLPESLPAGLAIMAAFSCLLGVGAYLLFTRQPGMAAALERLPEVRFLPLVFSRGNVIAAAVVLFALWMPIIVIMYPTGMTADTLNQLYQYETAAPTYYPTTGEMVDAEFIDHHPLFDTLLYGFFWQMGAVVGYQNAGIFALVLLQSAVLAVELAALVCYLDRLHLPYPLRLASLAFFALFPLFGHYAATVLKDVTYLTVFLPWSLMWVEAVRTRGRTFDDGPFLAAFMLLGGFCILTKKLGLYLLVPCLVVLVAVMRRHRVRLAASGVATVLVFALAVPLVLFPAVGGVAPGGRQEALGPAIQQMTTLLRDDPGALSPEELADVNRVFDVERAKADYEAFRSDAAKSTFHSDASTDDVLRFLQIWAAQGVRHPVEYLKSTAYTSGMLYVPFLKMTYYSGEDLSSRIMNYAHLNHDFTVDVSQPDNLVELNDRLEFESIESAISDLPVISLFFTNGFYGGWVPFIALVVVLFARPAARASAGRNAPAYVCALVPTLVNVALLLVCPVASPRYVLPFLYTAPLILGWAWHVLAQAHAE